MSVTVTQTNVTGSRAFNTVFQNTSGNPMFVMVYTSSVTTAPCAIQGFCDAANPPTTILSWEGTPVTGGWNLACVFLVPNNFFYKVTTTNAAVLGSWFESTIGVTNTTTQTNQTGSRVLGTVYQNNSANPMFVMMTATTSAVNSSIYGYSDPSSTPAILVARQGIADNGTQVRLLFIVPPDYHYKVTTDNGATINTWVETTIANPFTVNQYVPALGIDRVRAQNTVYTASTDALIVSTGFYWPQNSNGTLQGFTDNTAFPSTQILFTTRHGIGFGQLIFPVVFNNNYQFKTSSLQGPDTGPWVEWILGVSSATPNVRDNQTAIESISAGTPSVRDNQTAIESISAGTPAVHDNQTVLEGLAAGTPNVRDNQTVLEGLAAGTPAVRTPQIVLEIVAPFIGNATFVLRVQAVT